jgi:xanthine dehydrogenase small subunit
MFRKSVHFTVNGRFIEIQGKEAFAPLSDTLRYLLRQTGTKVVCSEGDCGACTIMLARAKELDQENLRFRSINSCILPTFLADACHIVTIEGLAQNNQLHEIQQSMVRNFGGQCGFCTPGFVMSISNMYEHKSAPTEQNIKNYLTGNLCRCTGYKPIIESAQDVDTKKLKLIKELYPLKSETKTLNEKTAQALFIESPDKSFFAPTTLDQAVEFKSKHPYARIFSGATDLGVQINKGKDPGNYQMSFHLISDLYTIKVENEKVLIGARVSLDRLQNFMENHIPAFADFLNIFASPQIKNSATLVGNLANGSPIADTTPFLMCLNSQVEILGKKGKRQKVLPEFITGYKKFDLTDDEFITGISFNLSEVKNAKMALYKISQRRDLDISCINASFIFKETAGTVTEAKISFGGVGPTTKRLFEVEKQIIGQKINNQLLENVKKLISDNITPISDVRGTEAYRKLMAMSLFEKFAKEQLGI